MTANTGRTVGKWFKFQIEDAGGAMRDLPVNTIGGVGIDHEEVDQSALQDALKGMLPGHGNMALDIGGPLDTKAAATASATTEAPALSGSHTILAPLNGATTPLNFGVYLGVGHYWEAGEPVFGIASPAATDGVLVFGYQVDPASMTYTAKIRLVPGSKAPTWGTAAVAPAA